MADEKSGENVIKETDIVFDCPYCGKSLAIDYRGAGLTIPCTDCGGTVEVPIPEGMEITDFDSTGEEQEMRILNLRKSLADARARVEELEEEVDALRERRETLESERMDRVYRLGEIVERVELARRAHAELGDAVEKIAETARGDRPPPEKKE